MTPKQNIAQTSFYLGVKDFKTKLSAKERRSMIGTARGYEEKKDRGDKAGSGVVALQDGFYFESCVAVGLFHDGLDDLSGGFYKGFSGFGKIWFAVVGHGVPGESQCAVHEKSVEDDVA